MPKDGRGSDPAGAPARGRVGGGSMSGSEASAAAGMQMAARAIHAAADGRDDEALTELRTGTHEEATWAAGYLLGALRESTLARFRGSPSLAALALHTAAKNVDKDVKATRLTLRLQSDLAKGDSVNG